MDIQTFLFLKSEEENQSLLFNNNWSEIMYRNILVFLIIATILISCAKKTVDTIEFNPAVLKAGDKVSIRFSPQKLIGFENQNILINIIGQYVGDQETRTIYLQMKKNNHFWEAELQTHKNDCLLSVKFEDNVGRVEDNDGIGWNLKLTDHNYKIKRNANFYSGQRIIQSDRNAVNFYNKQAILSFKNELELFPDNYQVWFHLWTARLKLSNDPQLKIKEVKSELDSLLNTVSTSPDLLILAFDTNIKLLNNPVRAIKYGETLLQNFQSFPDKDRIDFSLIFLQNQQTPEKLFTDLATFAQQTKSEIYKKKAYMQLGIIFQQLKVLNKAIENFEKYIALEPNDINISLSLASLYLEIDDYSSSQKMIERAQHNNTEENYIQNNPWEPPSERTGRLNLTQCQILSTQAMLSFKTKNYQQAIESRKNCIEIGTPFPAYEWEKIGDIYFFLNDIENSRQAYIRSLSINFSQNHSYKQLKNIYQSQQGNAFGFEEYLQKEIKHQLEASAQFAPDIEVTTLDGKNVKLSENKGSIIVITFWDSWSKACVKEIRRLNLLVNDFKNNDKVLFWAISIEAPISIEKFIKKQQFDFLLFHCGLTLKNEFSVIGFPTHFIIDKQGKIRYKHIGYSPNIREELKSEINLIINEDIIS